MKILITGAKGMLAQAVIAKFKKDNQIIATDSKELDITDFNQVISKLMAEKPDFLINCAAYTDVDGAELHREVANRVNAEGPKNLAKACRAAGTVLVHISTDYVFGGNKPIDQEYAEDDPKNPNTIYGQSKLAGEQAIAEIFDNFYIFRTAWLYGEGHNFVRVMLAIANRQLEKGATTAHLSVVGDQYGSPTYTEDLTDIIYQAITQKIPFGIYNATDLGNTTWANFATEIFKLANVPAEVAETTSEEYEKSTIERAKKEGRDYKVAPRPKNSQMSKQKLLDAGVTIPTWQDGLARYIKKELKNTV